MAKVAKKGPESKRDVSLPLGESYLLGHWKKLKNAVPSIAGLACYIGVCRETIYQWGRESADWKRIIACISTVQEMTLIDKTLPGDFNPNFAKVLMAKHGYSEKQEIDHTSSDGSMTPKQPTYKIVNQ